MRFLKALIFMMIPLPALAVPIDDITTPGGQSVWLVEDHSLPFVAVELLFRGGASLDEPGKRGATYLMTSTLEEGAGDLDARGFAEALEGLGASFRFDADDDTVSVSARMLSENRDQAASLLASALSAPRFDTDAVERVRAQIAQSILADQKDPGTLASEAFAAQAWGSHPYATVIKGTSDSLAALSRDDLIAVKDRIMARDHAIVSVVGDVTADQAAAMVDTLLAGLPARGGDLPGKAAVGLSGGVTAIDWDSPQSVVIFGQPGLPLLDPDYFPLMVANHILGGPGFSARLMDEIREKRGLTYGISTYLVNKEHGDLWQGAFSASNDKVGEAIRILRAEWARMAEGGVTGKELTDAKTYLTGSYPLRFDGNGTIASLLAGMQLVGLDTDYVNRRNALVDAVTSEDVARVAAKYMRPDGLRIVVAGQPEGVVECGGDSLPCAAE